MPDYNPLATEFSPTTSEFSHSTIPAELKGELKPDVSPEEAQYMPQSEGMYDLLTYFMEKDEREVKEREEPPGIR